jgi:hypothetical protein
LPNKKLIYNTEMKSPSNKPLGCSRLIAPVAALGILSSLLMPEVRDGISELLFPTTPQHEHPSSMEVTVDTNGKVNGVLLSGEVAYKYYLFVQEQLDQSAPNLIEKLKKAGAVWNTETDVEKMHQDVSDILISNPTIKDYIERGFIRT